jgi:hypothetical protein
MQRFIFLVSAYWQVLVPAAVAITFSLMNLGHFFEDALIYARYIENFLNGKGLVYNEGVFYNGLTSPLFTYLSILVSLVLDDVILSANLISALALVGIILSVEEAVDHDCPKLFISFGLICIATCQYTYTLFGMETLLFFWGVLVALRMFKANDDRALLLVLTLLFLVRSEAIFLAGAMVLARFWIGRSLPSPRLFVLPILLLAVHYIFTYQYYGALLPETAMAKIYQGQSGLFGEVKPLFVTGSFYIIDWYFLDSKLLLAGFISLAFIGVFASRRYVGNAVICGFLSMLLLFYCVTNIPNYHWYNAPFIFFMFIYSGIGLWWLSTRIFASEKIAGSIAVGGACLVGVLFILELELGAPKHDYVEAADWLIENTEGDAEIAMVEIGIIGYLTGKPIVDILGLVNPHNARLIGERDFFGWLEHYSPDYILIHDPAWIHEVGTGRAISEGTYVKVNDFQMNGLGLFRRTKSNE